MRDVLGLRHYVLNLELRASYPFLDKDLAVGDILQDAGWLLDHDDDNLSQALDQATGDDMLRERFHRSTYRLLLMAAALCPAYLEPFFQAPKNGPDGFVYRVGTMNRDLGAGDFPDELSLEDCRYLDSFPIYDFEASPEKSEPVYGDLARFLLDDLKTTAIPVDNERLRPAGLTRGDVYLLADPADVDHLTNKPLFSQHLDSQQTGWLQELMWVYLAYEVQAKYVGNFWPHRQYESPCDILTERRVPAVMFGIFYPGWVVTIDDGLPFSRPFSRPSRTGLDEFDIFRGLIGPWTLTLDLGMILERRHRGSSEPMSQQMNHRDGFWSPPPQLRVFEFMMRKYFDVGFRTDLFSLYLPVRGRSLGPDYKIYHVKYVGHIQSFREEGLKDDEFGIMELILQRYKEPTLSSDLLEFPHWLL